MKLPWFKFFGRDWIGDTSLRSLSYAARGLWVDMLCFMDAGKPRGYLVAGGTALKSAQDIARVMGGDESEVQQLLNQLENAEVFSRDSQGIIYSRRMVRDTGAHESKRNAGRQGGNPRLLNHEDNQPDKHQLNRQVNPIFQSPDTRDKHTHSAHTHADFPAVPTLEEVKTEALTCGLSAEEAERFWHHWQERHWQRENGASVDWKHNLRTWTPKGARRPAGKRTAKSAAKRLRWQIEKDIKAAQTRIEELKQEHKSWVDQYGAKHDENELTPEAQEKLMRERERLKKLQAEFDTTDD